MNKNIIYALFLGLGVIIGGIGSHVVKSCGHRPPKFEHKKLNKEDREVVRSLFKEEKKEVKSLMDQRDEIAKDLRLKLQDEKVSDEELKLSYSKFHEINKQLADRRFDFNLKLRKQLGADKMKDFDVLGPVPGGPPHRGDRGHRMKGGRGDMPPPPSERPVEDEDDARE